MSRAGAQTGAAEAGTIDVAFRSVREGFTLDARFSVPARGVTALVGPSGCGKTTVLRCIAGLERSVIGHCRIDGQTWQDGDRFVATHKRPLGYVFQEASLFPHLSVRRNLLYAPVRRPGAEGRREVGEIVHLLGIEALLDRMPDRLSGGERQRVAIGRALLSRPRILLMDEPVSALDDAAKEDVLSLLEVLHRTSSVPVLYVSHDMTEVERLADHAVLMEAGRIRACGALHTLQSAIGQPWAARRQAAVTLDATVVGYDAQYGLAVLQAGGVRFEIPSGPMPPGTPQRLRIAAADVSLARHRTEGTSILNVVPARILKALPVGPHEMVTLLALPDETDQARLLARITQRSWDRLALAEGQEIWAQIKGVALIRSWA